TPFARSAGDSRAPDLWRCEVRFGPPLRPGGGAARPRADLPSPRPLRADHAQGRRPAAVARAVRVPVARGPGVSDTVLNAIRDLIQQDVGGPGLATQPREHPPN